MPRNASGTYTLPAGNPVEAGTLIEANWANTTLDDVANELTNSLSRTGEGGMLAPFRLADGTVGAPGIAWLNEPSSGFYRAGIGEMWGVVQGTQVLQYTANGVLIPTGRTFTVQGNATIGGTLSITGAVAFTGNATVGGTLAVTGAITATGGVNGNVTGNLTGNVTGNVSGNAGTVTNGVYTNGSYADPAWITSLAGSKVTGNISGNAGNVTGVVAIANGGTGQTTANAALNALLPSQATQSGKYLKTDGTNASWDQLDISTADITGTLPIANGGTNATTAAAARTNLGLAIGTDVPSPTGTGASGTWGINISGNAATVTNGVYTNGSYADPSWLTSLAGSKITGNISGNAATATALANTRTIWGQNFNGTANVSGALTGVTDLTASGNGSFGGTFGVTGATTLAANLNLTGSGARITGDFSNATVGNRVVIQSSTMNGNTAVTICPNGTAANSSFFATNSSDPNNASTALMRVNLSEMALISGITGTGSYLPMAFLTNNTTQLSIATSGFGTATQDWSFQGVRVGRGAGAQVETTVVGNGALASNSTGNQNTAIGFSALTTSTAGVANAAVGAYALRYFTGSYNIAVGVQSMQGANGSSTGSSNTAIGHQSLYANTTGQENVAVGRSALITNTTGASNTALGTNSLFNNLSGGQNTGVGYAALASNTTAAENTALGYQAGYSNTTGIRNTAVGAVALYTNTTGSTNDAFGYKALEKNTTASNNVALGAYSLQDNTTGASNAASGQAALNKNTTGSNNTAHGYFALYSNTTASSNTAVGYQALYSNTTGTLNTALGTESGKSITTQSFNTFVGRMAGRDTTSDNNTFVGLNAGIISTTGSNNTFIGANSGDAVTTGGKNTILGRYNGNQGGLDIRTANNYIVLSDGDGNPRQIIDGSGNLGLGVTPNTWTLYNGVFQNGSCSIASNGGSATAYGNNWYYNGGDKYRSNGAASIYFQNSGTHIWYTSASGTAGNAISFTQAMTLSAGANLGVGETNPTKRIHIGGQTGASSAPLALQFANDYSNGATAAKCKIFLYNDGANNIYGFGVGSNADVQYHAGSSGLPDGNHRFYTGETERIRITSGGYFKASNSGGYFNPTGTYHELFQTASEFISRDTNSNATPYGSLIYYNSAAPNNTGSEFLYCSDTGAVRATIRSNGGLANYSGNNVNLSDRREKTNFAPAKSYLDTICAIPVQTFNYIDQSEDDPGLTLGVVAQDVQAVAPELVMESNWGTEDNPKMRLSIYQTDLQYALMKCIQELKAQNDDLRARVAQLEAK